MLRVLLAVAVLLQGSAGQPVIEANDQGDIVLNVPDGQKVYARYGSTLEELVPLSSLTALEERLAKRIQALEDGATTYTVEAEAVASKVKALEGGATKQEGDMGALTKRVKDSEDAVADQGLRLQSVESSVKDQEARVSAAEELGKNHQGSQKMDEAIAKVTALASEVEGFSIKATFSKSLASNLGDSPPVGAGGWTYFYNPTAAVGSKASYKPLLDEPQQGNQNCLRPTRGTFPAAIPAGYGHICSIDGSAPAGHVGPGKNNEGLEFDVGIIAAYTVPEDQFYSILDSTLLTNDRATKANTAGMGRMTGGLKAHVLVGDKEVCSVTTLGEQSGHTEFNCLLGKLTKGTVIYVAITGNGNAAYGSFRMDFSVGTGLQAAIQSSTEHRATMTDVEDELAFDTADFRADFANNGFSYMLNKGKLTEPTKFVPLKNVAGGPFTCDGQKTLPRPTSTACPANHGYTQVARGGTVHPGSAGGFVVIKYYVSRRGIYTLTRARATGSTKSDGIEIKIFVQIQEGNKYTDKVTMVADNHVAFRGSSTAATRSVGFDTPLGLLPEGANVYVAVGPGPKGVSSADTTSLAFAVTRGPAAMLTPAANGIFGAGPLPVLGGAMIKTTLIHWQGTAQGGAFNAIVEGADEGSAADERLEDGTYFFRTEPITTSDGSDSGTGLLKTTVVSSIFVWSNTVALKDGREETAIDTHWGGRSYDDEKLTFQIRVREGNALKQRLQLGFVASTGWSSEVPIRFAFVRLY